MLLSLVVLFTPDSGVPSDVPVNDKVVHATLFALLALTGRYAGARAVALAAALAAYAVTSELVQGTPLVGRDSDWRDVVADVVGVLLGLLLAAGVARRHRRP